MNTQKTQTSNVKGFTLVELIVVITILVILGTIAFLNLGGMSATARDAQRTSDLKQINDQIMIAQAKQGLAYSNMLSGTTASQISPLPSIGGTGSLATDYFAGDVNYTVLGIDQAKFQDPVSKVAYKMGVTTRAGSAYELAASLEETKTALVMGTYKARTIAGTVSTGTGVAGVVTLGTGLGNFKLNDYIGNGTATGMITSISADLKTITTNPNTMTGTNFTLNSDETTGLIHGPTGVVGTVTNKGTALPY